MYADRVEATSRRSIKERLYGNTGDDSIRRRQFTGKRQRQDDDKWEHDLYKDDEPQVSNRIIGGKDLRLKLQKKSVQQESLSGNGSVSGVRDLREKLSGTMYSQPVNTDPPKPKRKPVLKDNKSVRNNVIVEAPEPETKKVASSAESVDSFLQSLGLEKYSITFQVEEVDMTALVHMTGEDLKALGIPMVNLTKLTLVYREILPCYDICGSKKEDTFGIGIQCLTFGVDQVLLHVFLDPNVMVR
ncbi:hypothetical protein TEA_025227 [Camellia sinensis var. sinensis]|uniref:SAM domain-containing protein n=1 Tax=Camellia sinensis var. sinensis TaxID=542762 RepID=A0A4V3WQZ0_CAMSN|nr:hypothetical protein TEA_025227 [Camellia sinensis var. sinensis]